MISVEVALTFCVISLTVITVHYVTPSYLPPQFIIIKEGFDAIIMWRRKHERMQQKVSSSVSFDWIHLFPRRDELWIVYYYYYSMKKGGKGQPVTSWWLNCMRIKPHYLDNFFLGLITVRLLVATEGKKRVNDDQVRISHSPIEKGEKFNNNKSTYGS